MAVNIIRYMALTDREHDIWLLTDRELCSCRSQPCLCVGPSGHLASWLQGHMVASGVAQHLVHKNRVTNFQCFSECSNLILSTLYILFVLKCMVKAMKKPKIHTHARTKNDNLKQRAPMQELVPDASLS